jgi:hypothetical protein
MKVWLAAIIGLAGHALAGGVDTWPSRDVDLGRIYTAPDGWSAMVLVSRVHAYPNVLDEWFGPRVEALAGEGVSFETQMPVERLPGGAMQQWLTLGENAPPTEVVVTAYETPAGNQMLVTIWRADGPPEGRDAMAAFVASHVAAGDVWMGEAWSKAEPLPPLDMTGLDCRMEQQPSVVWVINWECKVECFEMCESACGLAPISDMTLIDAEVCRKPR